jgi:arylsulfatase A-like enzyme
VFDGCREATDADPLGYRTILLRSQDFGFQTGRRPAPEARIGLETRAAIESALPRQIVAPKARPIRDGVVRIELPGVNKLSSRLATALIVTAPSQAQQGEGPGVGQDALVQLGDPLRTIVRGWRLEAPEGPDDEVTLVVPASSLENSRGGTRPESKRPRRRAFVGVRFQAPVSERYESRLVEIPEGAAITLAWGATQMPNPGPPLSIDFGAQLSCDGGPIHEIVHDTLRVTFDENPGWQERTFTLPTSGRECRLTLENSRESAALGLSAWALPRIRLPDPGPLGPSLILISLDTLRSDHLSGYGYPRETSPTMDRELLGRGTTFTDVTSTFPVTHISHMSLFSGLYPAAQPSIPLWRGETRMRMLAESLRDAGFVTTAFTENGWVSAASGFARGFLRFVEHPFVDPGRGARVFAEGADFVQTHRDQRFFLFLHTYKVHLPYNSGPEYAALFRDDGLWESEAVDPNIPLDQHTVVDEYDRAIRELDDQVAGFLRELEGLGVAENTFVVVISDHGEAFGEHGRFGHGLVGNEEQLKIPLVIRGPGVAAGRRVDTPVSITDVTPTLLDLLDVPWIPGMQGRSLRGAIGGRVAEPLEAKPIYFSWIGNRTRGVREDHWKLLQQAGESKLYDLSNDPYERSPVLDAERLRHAAQLLDRHLHESAETKAADSSSSADDGGAVLPDTVRDSLRALGYIE